LYAAPSWTAACPVGWLGKVFWIRGRGVVKCEDTGSKVKGHIDIFFETHQEAVKWGRQRREVVEVTELFTRPPST
jgi:3D (Asp-Asp-Asp) domain-containing protein